MSTAITKLVDNQTFRICVLVAAILVVVFGGGVKFLNYESGKNAKQWLSGDLDRFAQQRDLTFPTTLSVVDEQVKNRLEQQYDSIRGRAKTHQEIMIYYYSRYYMAITMATITGIIATMMMAIISKKGWENTSPYIIAIFLTTSGLTAYFAAFPTLFEQKRNIEDNKTLYAIYLNLEDRLQSYAATGEDVDGKSRGMNLFIHEIDKELAKNNKLPIELNQSGVSQVNQDVMKRMNQDMQ